MEIGDLIAFNNILLFRALTRYEGRELWRSDGTAAGTFLLKNIYPDRGASEPMHLVNVNGTVFFSAGDQHFGRELWRSDGSAASTIMVRNIAPNRWDSSPEQLTKVGGLVFFTADDRYNGREVWRSDGTLEGTFLVKDIEPEPYQSSYPSSLTSYAGQLYFCASGAQGSGLWRSDGTEEGTVLVVNDICGDLTVFNGMLFFSPSGTLDYTTLWQSDGTTEGTFMISGIQNDRLNPRKLTPATNQLFFTGLGVEPLKRLLWVTDGTAAGSRLLQPLVSPPFEDPADLTPVNNTLYFTAQNTTYGRQLYRSDGTESGTISLETQPLRAKQLAKFGNTLLFSANDDVYGQELWHSDGTPEGTSILKDLIPGAGSSHPDSVTQVTDTWALFSAYEGESGIKLWKTNGNAGDTLVVQDNMSFTPVEDTREFVVSGDKIYFVADDGKAGEELWALPITNFDPDGDNDNLPDAYETQFGFDPANPEDAALDSDGDGFSNLEEYRIGSNPNDKASNPGRLRFETDNITAYASDGRFDLDIIREGGSNGVTEATIAREEIDPSSQNPLVELPYLAFQPGNTRETLSMPINTNYATTFRLVLFSGNVGTPSTVLVNIINDVETPPDPTPNPPAESPGTPSDQGGGGALSAGVFLAALLYWFLTGFSMLGAMCARVLPKDQRLSENNKHS